MRRLRFIKFRDPMAKRKTHETGSVLYLLIDGLARMHWALYLHRCRCRVHRAVFCVWFTLSPSIYLYHPAISQSVDLSKKKNDQMNDIEIKPEKHHPTNPGYVAIFQKQLVGYILLVLKYIYVAAWLHTTYTVGDKFPDKPTKKCIKFLEKFRKFSKFYQGLQKQIRNTYLQYIYQQSLSGQFSEIFPFILRKNSSKFMAGNLLSVVCISK